MGPFPRWTAAALALALAAGCGSDLLLGPDADQGIEGLALRGPLCPVAGPDCPDEPYAAEVRILTSGGFPVTVMRAGTDGRFAVGLLPGRYRVVGVSGDPFPAGEELDVTVPEGEWVEVTLHFDTGIR